MKVPFSWLKELVDIDVTAQELEEKLFSCGFEVEELIPLDAGISKVVVGKIVEMEPQEGTHLTKCVVDCGSYGHDIHISTGASNMKLGDCVPAALDGSTLPGGIKIKARKMQGVESNGMLCSGEELGLNDDLFPGSEVYGLLILPEVKDSDISTIAPTHNGKPVPTGVLVYGHMPLMVTRACPLQNIHDCAHCDKTGLLTDRKAKKFPVRCGLGVRTIYNPVPIYMGDKPGALTVDYGVAYFTLESREEAAAILDSIRQHAPFEGEFTRGLYFKGTN